MPEVTVLSAIHLFLRTYTPLSDGTTLILTDQLKEAISYNVVPLPGTIWLERWIGGGGTKQFDFALQAAFQTAAEETRLNNSQFHQALSEWLDAQTEAGVLPDLPVGKTAERIEAVQAGFLYQEGQSGQGVYQINCRLVYSEEAS